MQYVAGEFWEWKSRHFKITKVGRHRCGAYIQSFLVGHVGVLAYLAAELSEIKCVLV